MRYFALPRTTRSFSALTYPLRWKDERIMSLPCIARGWGEFQLCRRHLGVGSRCSPRRGFPWNPGLQTVLPPIPHRGLVLQSRLPLALKGPLRPIKRRNLADLRPVRRIDGDQEGLFSHRSGPVGTRRRPRSLHSSSAHRALGRRQGRSQP